MSNEQPISPYEPDRFLQYLLRCALTAPDATTSPTAGRILARLLVVGAIEGGDPLVSPYLVPTPGHDAIFDVRTYQPGDLVPTEVREGLGAAEALKVALRRSRESDEGIEVVSRDETGLERCVLVRDSTGDFEFRFASPETLIGEAEQCAAARNAWDATLSSWRSSLLSEPGGLDAQPADRDTSEDADSGRPAPDWAVLSSMADLPPMAEPLVGEPGTDTRAPVDPVLFSDTLRSDRDVPRDAPVDPLSRVVGEPLSDAIREAISNLVVEVDLGQVEQLIRRVLDDDRREFVEPLARRLAARLEESLDLPDSTALLEAVSRAIPRSGELAEAVAADVGALLSETLLRRRPGDPVPGGDGLQVLAGIEQLQVRLDSLQDQLHKSAGLLQLLGDHLEAGDRRAAVAERVTISADQEMQRLAARIDEQVAALVANAAGGSELSDGVARLTRKLRQSVTQLDRALVRLDDLFDQANGRRPRRVGDGDPVASG